MGDSVGRVVELFAGVGGFRLGVERAGWRVVWSNQWEPGTKKQHASECYVRRFGAETASAHVCDDIAKVLDETQAGRYVLPEHEMVVGGFPCQDYSVAKTLSHAHGINGKKGVLWWEIWRLLQMKRPPLLFLENVDRLLKSPASQRGRDFAIMLSSLAQLGYTVEWRVINAAEYGFPQKRRRVFIVGRHSSVFPEPLSAVETIVASGVMPRAFPVNEVAQENVLFEEPDLHLLEDLAELTETFGGKPPEGPFHNAGVMWGHRVWTRRVTASPPVNVKLVTLGDVLQAEDDVPDEYYVSDDQLDTWRYLKGAKKEERTKGATGFTYIYAEGPLPFPDRLDQPARTMVTGEGGPSPSRFKHIILTASGRYRRLTPVEMERLNGFPDDWTEGMPASRRAFCMGNALVVGVVERIAQVLAEDFAQVLAPSPAGATQAS